MNGKISPSFMNGKIIVRRLESHADRELKAGTELSIDVHFECESVPTNGGHLTFHLSAIPWIRVIFMESEQCVHDGFAQPLWENFTD